jgi:hypothetical protein
VGGILILSGAAPLWLQWTRAGDGLQSIEQSLQTGFRQVSAELFNMPPVVGGVADPMLLAAKVKFAQELNGDFTCASDPLGGWRGSLPSDDGTLHQVDLRFESMNVCWSNDRFRLEVSTPGDKPCITNILGEGLAAALVASIERASERAGLEISRMRVVGHASREEIHNCELDDRAVQALADSDRPIARSDRSISNNDQLAYVRAAVATMDLKEALGAKLGPSGSVASSLGVLDAARAANGEIDDFGSRRVTFEIRLARRIKDPIVVNTTISAPSMDETQRGG